MDADLAAFSLVSAFTLVAALATVLTRKLFSSALLLAATLVGVAFVFLTLGAEFLFIVQILVYVGAIVTLILFAIMFTHGAALEEDRSPAHDWVKALLCVLLLGGLVLTITRIGPWLSETPQQESWPGLASGLFDTWVFPFELLSILLLGALVGALYLSAKERRTQEDDA